MNSWATPRWVTGIPTRAGTAIAEVSPGTTRDRHAGVAAGQQLLEAAAEDEAVAALEADHPLAGQRPVDDQLVDLPPGAPSGRAGSLATSTSSTWGPSSSSSSRGRQPVGDDHVGRGERVPGRPPMTSSGSPGPPPTRTTPGGTVVGVGGGELPVAQARSRISSRSGRGLARLPVAEHRHGDARRGGPTAGVHARRRAAVVAAHAEDPALPRRPRTPPR